MQKKTSLSANDIERLKREAKSLKSASGKPLWHAQDTLAKQHGYENWSLMQRARSKGHRPTAAGLERACIEFINSLSDSGIEGLCKGASIWAPAWQIQTGAFGEIEVLGSTVDLSTRQYARQSNLLLLSDFGGLDESFVFKGDDDYEEDEDGNAIEPTHGQVFTPERGRATLLSIFYGDSIDGVMENLERYLNPSEQ